MREQATSSSAKLKQEFAKSHQIVKSLKAKADAKRTASQKFADWMTAAFGSVTFLTLNALWFAVWIAWNVRVIPGLEPFDPFPFGLLTMLVSLEAIFLSIFVLISQNRASQIADLREEVDLQVDITTEQELTKLLHMMSLLLEKQGIDVSHDGELSAMLKPTDIDTLEEELEREVTENGSPKNE
jgi:uncharacterized membrane protein